MARSATGAPPPSASRASGQPARPGPTRPMPSMRARSLMRCRRRCPEHEAAVGAAEAERIAHRARDGPSLEGGLVARAQRRIEGPRPGTRGNEAVADREERDGRLEGARRAQRVARRALGGVARHRVGEDGVHALVLGRVVARRGGAVQVHVVDVGRAQPRGGERALDRQARPQPLRMRRRHVVRIARFADAQQPERPGVRRGGRPLEEEEGTRLADGNAVPRPRPRGGRARSRAAAANRSRRAW